MRGAGALLSSVPSKKPEAELAWLQVSSAPEINCRPAVVQAARSAPKALDAIRRTQASRYALECLNDSLKREGIEAVAKRSALLGGMAGHLPFKPLSESALAALRQLEVLALRDQVVAYVFADVLRSPCSVVPIARVEDACLAGIDITTPQVEVDPANPYLVLQDCRAPEVVGPIL